MGVRDFGDFCHPGSGMLSAAGSNGRPSPSRNEPDLGSAKILQAEILGTPGRSGPLPRVQLSLSAV
jgi:hypothetical protein